MLSMVLVTFTRPCFAANLLDPGKFSQTLTKLATDGLGTGSLQVTITLNVSCYTNAIGNPSIFSRESFVAKPSVLILGPW